MRKVFVSQIGRMKALLKQQQPGELALLPTVITNDDSELAQAAYKLGYEDAKNEPYWRNGQYHIANKPVGGMMKDPGSFRAFPRAKGWIDHCPHYGGRITKFFSGENAVQNAREFVEKNARSEAQQ